MESRWENLTGKAMLCYLMYILSPSLWPLDGVLISEEKQGGQWGGYCGSSDRKCLRTKWELRSWKEGDKLSIYSYFGSAADRICRLIGCGGKDMSSSTIPGFPALKIPVCATEVKAGLFIHSTSVYWAPGYRWKTAPKMGWCLTCISLNVPPNG